MASAVFDDTCNNFNGTAAKIERVTVALPRATNMKDELTSAKLDQSMGKDISIFRPDNY